MESDGPYFITQEHDAEIGANWSLINGPGIKDPKTTATQDYTEAKVSVRIRNVAYAEGRKSIMPALEKAEMALKDVHDGYLDATPDGSTFFDWIVWDRLATEALSAIRDARGKK